MKEQDEINHVLVVTDGVMRKIAGVVIGADDRNELVQKALGIILEPSFLSRQMREGIPHADVRSIDAQDTPPFRLQVVRNPCTVFDDHAECPDALYCSSFRVAVTALDRSVAAPVFQMTAHNITLALFLPCGECSFAIETIYKLNGPLFVHAFSSSFCVETFAEDTPD